MRRPGLTTRFLAVSGGVIAGVFVLAGVLHRQLTDGSGSPADHQRFVWIFASLVAMLVIVASLIQSSLVLPRLRRILRGMEEVRSGGYPRILADGDDELADTVRGFNETVDTLRSRDEKLRAWAGNRENELMKLSHELDQERERLDTVMSAIGDGVIVLDSDNKVLMANRRVSEIFGVPVEHLQGCDLSVLIEQVRHRLLRPDLVEKKVMELKRAPSMVDEVTLELDDPGRQAIRLYSVPVRGADGTVVGRIATSLDLGREREIERMKAEFLSTISHELRTPLTSIKGSLGLVLGGAAGTFSADARELLDIARSNTDRLVRVINQILDMMLLERGQALIRPVPMPLGPSGERALRAVAAAAQASGVEVHMQIPPDLPNVLGDSRRVEQVLVNLLANAIKYSARGREVMVSAVVEGDAAHVSVKDSGCGMSAEFLERLFTKFEHAQSSLTREKQGMGLGLATCRHIVQAHGGRIWAETKEGTGSTFHFTLPLSVSAVKPPEPPPILVAGDPSGAPRLVLVIDNDEDVTRILSYIFETQGHQVISAHSGNEALELARRHRPDLITLDLNLPDIDGFDVLKQLRAEEESLHTPVICISVRPDVRLALALGADYCMEKPLDIDRLRELSGKALATVR
ncbi:MAG TPA: ATP-binding protein [Candidatus Acidoferrales bacterium]|nr:ATP-binding protein [Candidatus Acidoferrales bacterium]